jgi:tRNA-splicing ligase RtcB
MADAHWGYGFPIGGVAAFDPEKGIISPGGVGFDVNCLRPDTKVQDAYGALHPIGDLVGTRIPVRGLDRTASRPVHGNTVSFLNREEPNYLYRISTSTGKEIFVTEDHPVLTKRGMILAKDLARDDLIVVTGFDGIDYSAPEKEVLLEEDQLEATLTKLGKGSRGNAKVQILQHLRRRGLNVIDRNHPQLPILTKLLGLVFGDGTIPRVSGGLYTQFFGKEEDLIEVRNDIAALGFRSAIYHRHRHHRIRTRYGISEFDYEEYSLKVNSSSLALLLLALGAPYGKKTIVEYRLPRWLMNAEKWQKRLFVAAFFGAELQTPITNNGYNFSTISFSVSKLRRLSENALDFLADVKTVLAGLDVDSSEPVIVEGYSYDGIDGKSVGYRL